MRVSKQARAGGCVYACRWRSRPRMKWAYSLLLLMLRISGYSQRAAPAQIDNQPRGCRGHSMPQRWAASRVGTVSAYIRPPRGHARRARRCLRLSQYSQYPRYSQHSQYSRYSQWLPVLPDLAYRAHTQAPRAHPLASMQAACTLTRNLARATRNGRYDPDWWAYLDFSALLRELRPSVRRPHGRRPLPSAIAAGRRPSAVGRRRRRCGVAGSQDDHAAARDRHVAALRDRRRRRAEGAVCRAARQARMKTRTHARTRIRALTGKLAHAHTYTDTHACACTQTRGRRLDRPV